MKLDMIKGLDQTTVDGLTEAILIAMCDVRKDGLLVMPRLGNTPEDNMDFARQIASTLLGQPTDADYMAAMGPCGK